MRQLINKTTTKVDSLRCSAASAQSDSDKEENEGQFELVKFQQMSQRSIRNWPDFSD